MWRSGRRRRSPARAARAPSRRSSSRRTRRPRCSTATGRGGAPAAAAAMQHVDRAVARAGRGLDGDRYFDERGTFSNVHGRGYDLTLVDAEVLDELDLSPEDARRNVVTRGIDLNALVGERFQVGDVACCGARLCEPCAHLERLTPGTLRPLIHKGGLRADVLSDGPIAVGDQVTAG